MSARQIPLGPWTYTGSLVQVPAAATHVQYTMAPQLDGTSQIPVVGATGRVLYVTIDYDAAGIYTVGLGGGGAAVADVAGDGLGDEAAVLDHLRDDLDGIFGSSITLVRMTIDGNDTLVIAHTTQQISVQIDCTGGSATLTCEATGQEADRAVLGALITVAGQFATVPVADLGSGPFVGGLVDMPGSPIGLLPIVEVDTTVPSSDTEANAATLSLYLRVWLRFYRRA